MIAIDELVFVASFTFAALLLALFIHELTHALTLRKLGYGFKRASFKGGPLLKISVESLKDVEAKDQTKVLLLPLPVTLMVTSLIAVVAMLIEYPFAFHFWIAASVSCFIFSGYDIKEWRKRNET